jgi:hypothetical protein
MASGSLNITIVPARKSKSGVSAHAHACVAFAHHMTAESRGLRAGMRAPISPTMPPVLLHVLDYATIAAAIGSAWLWWLASGRRLRRIRRDEELDAADLNRLVTFLNRAQARNARAAILTAVASALAGVRLALGA